MEPFVLKEQSMSPSLLYIEQWMATEPRLTAGFSTRSGGVSEGDWATLNCAFHVADSEQHVIENRALIAHTIGLPFSSWTCAEQVHGKEVYEVRAMDRGKGRLSRENAIQAVDALVTKEADVLLTSFYADCVPLYFWDQDKGVVALAHAGWKGTWLGIAAETIGQMQRLYQCEPTHIKAAIGPAIGACCYEVDKEVAARFYEQGLITGVTEVSDEKFVLDLKQLNRQIMIKVGVLSSHIEMSQYCTACRDDLFYSHRRDRGRTGRMISWIGMRNEVNVYI